MKIVLLAPFCLDDPTFEAVFGGLGKAYHDAGCRVVAAGQLDLGSALPARERRPWGELRRLGGPWGSPWVYGTLTFFQLLAVLSDADFVHLHLIGTYNGLIPVCLAACALRGVPLGVTFQDAGNIALRPPSPRQRRLLQRLLLKARWITALSRATAEGVERLWPALAGRVVVVPNGFDPEELDRSSRSRAPSERPFALCVARLMLYKGIDVLLMAWRDVCDRARDLDLVLCGPDSQGGHHEALARRLGLEGRVRFLGPTPRARTLELMRRCRLFVFPSRHEAFGMAALEAMATGCPIVATRVGGLPDFIEDGVSGVLVPPKDPRALAQAVLRLHGDERLRRALGAQARHAAAAYRWSDVARSYLALMKSGFSDKLPSRRSPAGEASPA